MANKYFQFKQFKVEQHGAAMKVGTDGVLLGAWAPVAGCSRMLDVGTGTGLLALMCAQRNTDVMVDAVEIDPDAAQQALRNVAASPWSDRIKVVCTSFQQFAQNEALQYDLVVCNPPFFSNSLQAPEDGRNMARHDVMLPLPDLARNAAKILNHSGVLAVVLPPGQMQVLHDLMSELGFTPSRYLNVVPAPGKLVKRMLCLFSRTAGTLVVEELVVESDGRHGYSPEYKELTQDFYLAF